MIVARLIGELVEDGIVAAHGLHDLNMKIWTKMHSKQIVSNTTKVGIVRFCKSLQKPELQLVNNKFVGKGKCACGRKWLKYD